MIFSACTLFDWQAKKDFSHRKNEKSNRIFFLHPDFLFTGTGMELSTETGEKQGEREKQGEKGSRKERKEGTGYSYIFPSRRIVIWF